MCARSTLSSISSPRFRNLAKIGAICSSERVVDGASGFFTGGLADSPLLLDAIVLFSDSAFCWGITAFLLDNNSVDSSITSAAGGYADPPLLFDAIVLSESTTASFALSSEPNHNNAPMPTISNTDAAASQRRTIVRRRLATIQKYSSE